MIIPCNKDELKDGENPKSYYTKKNIIEAAIRHGCKPEAIETLKIMKREDVLAICLVRTGYCYCGSSREPGRAGFCKYYKIDYDFINSLGGCSIDC